MIGLWIHWTDGECLECSARVRVEKLTEPQTVSATLRYRCSGCGFEKSYTRNLDPEEITPAGRHQ